MFNKIRYIVFVVLGLSCSLYSCEKLFIKPDKENTPINNFELLWKDFDENYSFFEYKKINWDSLYNVYRPLVHNEMKSRDFSC